MDQAAALGAVVRRERGEVLATSGPARGDPWSCDPGLLARAVEVPSLGTVLSAAVDVEYRAAVICRDALASMVTAYRGKTIDPVAAINASRWAWIMPTLLLRPVGRPREAEIPKSQPP